MTELGVVKNIVILMAMHDEALPIVKALGLQENQQVMPNALPFRCFQSTSNLGSSSLSITLIISGQDSRYQVDNIGCEAATLMAYQAISLFRPDLLISAGTAGGFASLGADIGTIYISDDYFVFHDRVVPLPGFEEAGIGRFPAANLKQMASKLGFKTGVISTGSSLEKNLKDQLVLKRHQVVAKEMEAAAIAWVAMLHQVPVAAVKSITNLVDQDNQSEHEFVKNFDQAVGSLEIALLKVLRYFE